MSADWIPFHRRLAKGPKKSIPRGVRFVLLELSLEARGTEGVLDLPITWDTVEAVHDLLGGNRRELREALKIFQKPDETGRPALRIERNPSAHRLIITKWHEWAGPKSSTERVRQHRENKRLGVAVTFHDETAEPPTQQDRTEQNNTTQSAHVSSDDQSPEATGADPPEPPKPESPFDLARRVFCELYRRRYRCEFMLTDFGHKGTDEWAFKDLGHLAESKGNGDAEAWLRHWIREYLRDEQRFLVQEKHAPRFMAKNLNKYGEPKKPKARAPSVPPPPEPARPVTILEPVADVASEHEPSGQERLKAKSKFDQERLSKEFGGGGSQ